jgi:hypothetical protein
MSSRTSTSAPAPVADTGFRPWHLYVLLSMMAATAAVVVSKQTHPAALLVLSGAVMAAGVVGFTLHRALTGFAGGLAHKEAPLRDRQRDALLSEKTHILRSIKELEFDRATGKLGDADFHEMNARLRARALSLMDALERSSDPPTPVKAEPVVDEHACPSCRTVNDDDAKFCKQCGHKLR